MPGPQGAPLLDNEVEEVQRAFPLIQKYLSCEHLEAIEKQGLYVGRSGDYVTPVVANRACVFVTHENGIAQCSFEKAFHNNEITWQKPISCHLFPIRVDGQRLQFEYIPECAPALERGAREHIYLSDFLKDALIRAYGEKWFNEFYLHSRKRQEAKHATTSDTVSV